MDYQKLKSQYKSKQQINVLADNLKLMTQNVKQKQSAEHHAREAELEKIRAQAARAAIISSLEYASKIQKNLLPPESEFKESFSDYSIVWNQRDIVGGDIYWIKKFFDGAVLCVCDCTGHGTPGALLTMLVVSAFEAMVNESNYKNPAEIIRLLDQRLVKVLNVTSTIEQSKESIIDIKDGCDLAVLYISNEGDVSVSSTNIPVFICDGNEITKIKGQKLFVGEGQITKDDQVKVTIIPKNPKKKFYISTDGLFDQVGGERSIPFGYNTFKQIILDNHNQKQRIISDKIWDEFELYRGDQVRRDDVEFISFKPNIKDAVDTIDRRIKDRRIMGRRLDDGKNIIKIKKPQDR